jgi:hypothetical protein
MSNTFFKNLKPLILNDKGDTIKNVSKIEKLIIDTDETSLSKGDTKLLISMRSLFNKNSSRTNSASKQIFGKLQGLTIGTPTTSTMGIIMLDKDLSNTKLEKLSADNIPQQDKRFLKKLPRGIKQIMDEVIRNTKEECPKLKIDREGGFGQIQMGKDEVKKILDLIQEKDQSTLLQTHKFLGFESQLFFLVNRLNNFCGDINRFIKKSRFFFNDNFLPIYKCNTCKVKGRKIPKIYIEMALGKGETLHEILIHKQKELDKKKESKSYKYRTLRIKDIHSIYIQIYYITLVLNINYLFHNDMKPQNIIIVKSDKEIIYNGLRNKSNEIKMILPPGSYYPIFIDYDLSTTKKRNLAEVEGYISQATPDFSFFYNKIMNKKTQNLQKYNKILDKFETYDNQRHIRTKLYDNYMSLSKLNTSKILKIKYSKIHRSSVNSLVGL